MNINAIATDIASRTLGNFSDALLVAEAIRKAVADERQACAKIAREWPVSTYSEEAMVSNISTAIRDRTD